MFDFLDPTIEPNQGNESRQKQNKRTVVLHILISKIASLSSLVADASIQSFSLRVAFGYSLEISSVRIGGSECLHPQLGPTFQLVVQYKSTTASSILNKLTGAVMERGHK